MRLAHWGKILVEITFDNKFCSFFDEPVPGQTKFEQILQWVQKQLREQK